MKLKLKSMMLLLMAVSIIGTAFSFADSKYKHFEESAQAIYEASNKIYRPKTDFTEQPASIFNKNTYEEYGVLAVNQPFSKYKGDEKIVDGKTEQRYLGRHFYKGFEITNPDYPDDELATRPLHTWNWVEEENAKEIKNQLLKNFIQTPEEQLHYEAAIMIALKERFGDLFDETESANSPRAYFERAVVLQPMTEYSRGFIQFNHIKDDGSQWYFTIVTPIGTDPRIALYISTSELGEEDLLVQDIKAVRYPSGSDVKAYVTVENKSSYSIKTTLDFSVTNLTNQSKDIKLLGGEVATFEYDFSTKGSGSERMSAEINSSRAIQEITYDNNMLLQDIEVFNSTGYISGGCANGSNKVKWTETDSRLEERTGTKRVKKINADGSVSYKRKSYTYYVRIYYDFTYEAVIDLNVTVYDDTGKNASKGNSVGSNFTTRSGYGFFIEPTATVSYKQVSGKWNRSPNNKPSAPNICTLKMPWTIPTKDYRGEKQTPQSSKITFETISKNSYPTHFNLPSNPISKKYGYRKAYTFIDLEDGAYNYYVTVYADAPYKSICKTFVGTVNIKGTMHDDYRIY